MEYFRTYFSELSVLYPNDIQSHIVAPDVDIALHHPGFGAVHGPARKNDAFDEHSFYISQLYQHELKNVTILSPYQILTKNNLYLGETIFHFPFQDYQDIYAPGRNGCLIRADDGFEDIHLTNAICLNGGGTDSYYHWMLFYIAKINAVFLTHSAVTQCATPPVILLPPIENPDYKKLILAALQPYSLPYRFLSPMQRVTVERCFYPVNFHSMGLDPHPYMLSTFDSIRAILGNSDSPFGKHLYISNRDSPLNPLINEIELEAELQKRGYNILVLSQLSIEEQISAFAHASHIIAPYGEGLTNLLFCQKGTKILELSTSNWCYRRLSAIKDLTYGFFDLLPMTISQPYPVNQFKINIQKIIELIEDSSFS